MANASTVGFGLRAVMTVGNTPATSGQSEYLVQTAPGVGLYKGDPASIQDSSGAQGYAQDASFTLTDDGGAGGASWANNADALLTGVLNGFFYIDSTGKPTFANSVPSGTTTSVDYNTGSNNITAFVIDNPNQEYVVKADDAITQAGFGLVTSYNINNWTASTNKDGQSIATLDIASPLATKMFSLVRSANDPENKDLSVAGANVIVTISKASALYN
tara:strand:+ start:26 stop:676 length:651 start_codon:yes stop_codon:yes gene_type:complete